MITLHHLNNSRSQRIIWLLETLGIEYQIKNYQRDAVTSLAPGSLKKIHPLGKSPVITDGKKVIAESGLIIEYLCEQYANKSGEKSGSDLNLLGQEDNRFDIKYWLHYSEGSLMPFMVMKLVFEKIKTAPMPFFIKPIARIIADKALATYPEPNIANNLKYIEQHLEQAAVKGHHYFCGSTLTAADFQMIFPLEAANARQKNIGDNFPNIAAYVKRIHALPAYQKALTAGGQYDYA
jgi:glutathione S-transferase